MLIHCTRRSLAALALGLAGSRSAAAQTAPQKFTVALGGTGLFFSLHYIAKNGGFYRQEGLEAEDVSVQSGPQQSAAVEGGSADITLTGFEQVVHSVSQGGTLVAIADVFSVFPFSIVLSNDAISKSGITPSMSLAEKIKRMHGMTLGISAPGSAGDTMMRTICQVQGLSIDKEIRLQPVGGGTPMYAALENGIVNGFVWGPPFPEMAEAHGLGRTVVSVLDGDVPEYAGTAYETFVTSRATQRNKQPLLLAAVRALTRAINLVHQQPDEARRLVRPIFKELNDTDFGHSFDHALKGMPTTPVISRERVQKTIAMLNLTEKVPLKVTYEDVMYPDIAVAAAKDLLAK